MYLCKEFTIKIIQLRGSHLSSGGRCRRKILPKGCEERRHKQLSELQVAPKYKVQTVVRKAYYLSTFYGSQSIEEVWNKLKNLGLVKAKSNNSQLQHTVDKLRIYFAQAGRQSTG